MIRVICGMSLRIVSLRLLARTFNADVFQRTMQAEKPYLLTRYLHNSQYVKSVSNVLSKPANDDVNTLLSNLESQCTLQGYVNYAHLAKLLITLEDPSKSNIILEELSAKQTQFLLGASGILLPALNTNQRIEVFDRVWRSLHKHNVLTVDHYRAYLQVLHHNRTTVGNMEDFIHDLATKCIEGANNSEMLSLMLTVACAAGNMPQAAVVLSEIRQKNFPLSERNFASLLMGNAINGDEKGVLNCLDSMIAAGFSITPETQMMLACGYLCSGDTTKAMEILSRYHRQFDGEQVIQMLRVAVLHSKTKDTTDVVIQLINELPEQYISGTDMIPELQNICIELIYQHNISTVKIILKELPLPSFNENQDIDTFAGGLLHELFRAQININEIVNIAQMLVDCGKNSRALHIIAEIALRRNTPLTLPIFKSLMKQDELRPHYFWPLFMYNFRHQGENGILRTLKIMNDFNVECDESTLRQYVLPRLSMILDNPQQCVKQLNEAGVNSAKITTHLIKHLLSQQKIFEVLKLVEMYPSKLNLIELETSMTNLAVNVRATKRYYQYAKLFNLFMSRTNSSNQDFLGKVLVDALYTQDRLRNDANSVKRLLHELQKLDLSLSYDAANLIINAFKKESWEPKIMNQNIELVQKMRSQHLIFPTCTKEKNNNEVSSFIKHPRDMSVDELECHLIELESKQLNTRGVLRRLLQLCVRDGRLERALEIKTKCDELKVLVSPGMLASILDMHIKLNDLHKAQATFKRLQSEFPGFQVDEHKLIDLCTLLIQNKELNTAQELLQNRANSQRIQGGDYALKNVWNLLSSVAVLASQLSKNELPEEQNMTSEMFHLLHRLGYCSKKNAVLGPIVRERLLRGQIELAIKEFIQLAEQYKCTPLQYELLSLLISYCNDCSEKKDCADKISVEMAQELLSKVCDTVKNIHGLQNLNSALLLAFAESGTDGQLRRLFINPEFKINQDVLMKNCENLDQKGAVGTLLRLARNSRGVGHIIDEQRIYDMILQNCVERNDFVAALDLYERLNADDELKISQEFLRQLVKLLHINKLEVPLSIALRAPIDSSDRV